jgi:hypothetical protein
MLGAGGLPYGPLPNRMTFLTLMNYIRVFTLFNFKDEIFQKKLK